MDAIVAQFLNGRTTVLTDRKCGFCSVVLPATVYCENCARNLCVQCERAHKNNRTIFRNHHLTPFTRKTMCSDHPEQLYFLYCSDCSTPLCESCDVTPHVQHELRRPQDLAAERVAPLERSKLRACELSCRLLEHRAEVKDKVAAVHEGFAQARGVVRAWLAALRDIEDHLGGVLGELDGGEEAQVGKLEEYRADLAHQATMHSEFADFLEMVQDSPAIEIAQQQEGLTRFFPTLDLHQPPISLPRTPNIDIGHIRDMFDISYQPDIMFDLMSLSDDGYLDTEDEDLADPDPDDVIPNEEHPNNDVTVPTRPTPAPRQRIFMGPIPEPPEVINGHDNVESLPDLPPRHMDMNIDNAESLPELPPKRVDKSVDSEQLPSSGDDPPETSSHIVTRPVQRRISDVNTRLRRQKAAEKIPIVERQISVCHISKIAAIPMETKVYDVKWCPNLDSVIIRTGDAGCPLKGLSLTTLEVTPHSRVPLKENHLGLGQNTRTGEVVVTEAPGTLRMYNPGGECTREIHIPGAGKVRGVTYCSQADVYVITDTGNKQVVVVNATSGDVIARHGEDKTFESPVFISCDNNSTTKSGVVAISDRGHHAVKVSDLEGSVRMKFGRHGCAGNRKLRSPAGVWLDPTGGIVVCDWGNKRVVRFSLLGTMEEILTPDDLGGRKPFGLDVTPDGVIVVSTWEGSDSSDSILVFTGYANIGNLG